MGTLERLQNAVCEILSAINDLKFACVRLQNDFSDAEGSAEGLEIKVLRPIPLSASKYAAGPTFSDVDVCVEVVCDGTLATNPPSLLTVCEIISRTLHKWTPPLECGYGKMTLAQNAPWKRGDAGNGKTKITLKFNAQSVLS